jgi:hypothetical protein
VFFLCVPALGQPATEQCIAASEDAQRLVRNGSLLAARAELQVCMSASCPAPIQTDCKGLLASVDASMPTLVLDIRDATGTAVENASVTLDGASLPTTVTASPVSVDPGQHTLVVAAPGWPRARKTFTVNRGEKNRVERVDLGAPLTEQPTGGQPAETQHRRPILKTAGLVAAGVGAVGVGVGIYFGVKSKLTYDDAVDRCTSVPDACAPGGVRGGRDAHRQAAISTAAFAVGGVLLAAGTAVYFMVPDSDVRVESALEDGGVRLGLGATW